MFRKTNEELDLEGLDDFIEKPSQECSEEVLKNGVSKVVNVLSKNPTAIMTIIANHSFIPGSFLLDDLAEKMNKRNCKEQLGKLFDACTDDLIQACAWNLHDLDRCMNAIPAYSDSIMMKILSNENWTKKIFDSAKNSAEPLTEIEEKYPAYKDKLTESYNQYYNPSFSNKL
jgi:hypothetical protein